MPLATLENNGPSTDLPSTPTATSRRWWIVLLAGAIALAAVAAVALFGGKQAPVLISDGEGRISLIDVKTGEAAYTVTDAVRAPAGSKILRAEEEGKATAVEVLDPDSGEVVASTRIEGKLSIRAVSPFGGWRH